MKHLKKKKKCYNARNLLDYLHDQKYEKLTDRDLSRQTNTSIPQQINFEGKLEEHYGATMFFIAKKQQKKNKTKQKRKQQKTISTLSLDPFIITE